MKVILVNGGPHKEGCTYTALKEVEKQLNKNDIKTEIFWVGVKPIAGCIGCGKCKNTGKCFMNDKVNEFIEKAKDADGFVFGTPVHFASASGALTSFMDRVFYAGKNVFQTKLGAGVVSCRRGGATATFDQINKYFTINNMPIVSSQYWNMVHGNTPEEVVKDEEGMQTMRTLGNNMSWLLKCIEQGSKVGIEVPEREEPIRTNYIRSE